MGFGILETYLICAGVGAVSTYVGYDVVETVAEAATSAWSGLKSLFGGGQAEQVVQVASNYAEKINWQIFGETGNIMAYAQQTLNAVGAC